MKVASRITSAVAIAVGMVGLSSHAALVHHYSFDNLETGGNAIDSVGGANGIWDGDSGANIAAPGIIGTASQTNDEDGGNGQEHYTIASLSGIDGADEFSLSLWFNQDVANNDNSTYNGLFMSRFVTSNSGGGSENWGVALEDNGPPRHIDWRADGSAGTEFDDIPGDAGWHHVVMTYDGVANERSLYFDGALLITQGGPGVGSIVTGGSWDIGNDTCCGSREFTGTLDDVAVFDHELSAAEVTQIYNWGLEGKNVIGQDPPAGPAPGDVNGDGFVDGADFEIIRGNFFTSVTMKEEGDLTGDGFVDFDDFNAWKTAPPILPPASAVPEPGTAALFALGVGGLALRRRYAH